MYDFSPFRTQISFCETTKETISLKCRRLHFTGTALLWRSNWEVVTWYASMRFNCISVIIDHGTAELEQNVPDNFACRHCLVTVHQYVVLHLPACLGYLFHSNVGDCKPHAKSSCVLVYEWTASEVENPRDVGCCKISAYANLLSLSCVTARHASQHNNCQCM